MDNGNDSVTALWRYPVKSMQGEALNTVSVTESGLLGDRAYALLDAGDGKVGSAKNPRKWPNLLSHSSSFLEVLPENGRLSPVCITLPDGTRITSSQSDVDQVLSQSLARDVTLQARDGTRQTMPGIFSSRWTPSLEEYWPDIEGLPNRDVVTDEAMPGGTYFDCATIHLITTSTLDRLRELYPQGRFEVRRFRPNIVIATDKAGFVENDWIGKTLAIGDVVRLEINGPCPRCVMTTLPQGDLPKDAGILRAAARHNAVNVGVYASVVQPGTVRVGQAVRLA